jgi:hypothetical protein
MKLFFFNLKKNKTDMKSNKYKKKHTIYINNCSKFSLDYVCNHTFIDDYIDIDYEKSQSIRYCSICYKTLVL